VYSSDSPADLNTINTVNGTLYAYAQLFSSDPVVRTTTWIAHMFRGTWRGLSAGKKLFGRKVMKLGIVCNEMKSIWEKVKADPVISFRTAPALEIS
jgi:hypothetical protein